MRFFIIAVFGIAVIYCILSSVFGLFNHEEEEDKIDIDNIESYITIYSEESGEENIDNGKLVKHHSTYYTVQTAVQNYIQALIDGEYTNTYSILSDEMKEKYSKKEYEEKIGEFANNNFISSEISYDIEYCLQKCYLIGDFTYLCECNSISGTIIKIGIKLNTSDNTYNVFYVSV